MDGDAGEEGALNKRRNEEERSDGDGDDDALRTPKALEYWSCMGCSPLDLRMPKSPPRMKGLLLWLWRYSTLPPLFYNEQENIRHTKQ